MTEDSMDRDLFFFLCGFCATNENFNDEYMLPYLAPESLGQDYGGLALAFDALKSDKKVYAELTRLFAQAKAQRSDEQP